jgi:hypothetical protein
MLDVGYDCKFHMLKFVKLTSRMGMWGQTFGKPPLKTLLYMVAVYVIFLITLYEIIFQ